MALLARGRSMEVLEKGKELKAWLIDYVTAIKSGRIHPFTPLERRVREATRNEPWCAVDLNHRMVPIPPLSSQFVISSQSTQGPNWHTAARAVRRQPRPRKLRNHLREPFSVLL